MLAARVLACSFAIDLQVPPGARFDRARDVLRRLRAGLERVVEPLVLSATVSPPWNKRERANSDLRAAVGLGLLLKEEGLMEEGGGARRREEVLECLEVLRQRASRLVCAGAAGVLTSPTPEPRGVLGMLAGGVAGEGGRGAAEGGRGGAADAIRQVVSAAAGGALARVRALGAWWGARREASAGQAGGAGADMEVV